MNFLEQDLNIIDQIFVDKKNLEPSWKKKWIDEKKQHVNKMSRQELLRWATGCSLPEESTTLIDFFQHQGQRLLLWIQFPFRTLLIPAETNQELAALFYPENNNKNVDQKDQTDLIESDQDLYAAFFRPLEQASSWISWQRRLGSCWVQKPSTLEEYFSRYQTFLIIELEYGHLNNSIIHKFTYFEDMIQYFKTLQDHSFIRLVEKPGTLSIDHVVYLSNPTYRRVWMCFLQSGLQGRQLIKEIL